MSLEKNLERVVARHHELAQQMASGDKRSAADYARMAKEYADLKPIVEAVSDLRGVQKEMADLKALIADKATDAEMKALAEDELNGLKGKLPGLEKKVQLMLLPADAADAKNAILEIRAGTGGEEAALFAGELYRMYCRYAESRGWRVEIMSSNQTGLGGFKEIIVNIEGQGAYSRLKFEGGVHRVQRVPATEGSGRIHTSAVTVAVLPEADEVEIAIDPKDIRIDVFRSSGPGGQSVNTTDSAVRITHVPTGIVVSCQDEKSQHKNRAKGMKILRARLLEKKREEQRSEIAATRKSMVGSGDRSERIRTYNFPQGRLTDHRINLTIYQLDRVMEGEIDEIVEGLITHYQAEVLKATG